MRVGWLWHPLKWLLALGAVGGLSAGAYFVNAELRAQRTREAAGDKVESPSRARGNAVLLDEGTARRYGLKEEPAARVEWAERVPAYGQVVPNPRATTEVRVPIAGTLRADPATPWPLAGQQVRAGQTLGWIDVRVPPQERLTLVDNLNAARLKKEGAGRVVQLQQERVDRLEQIAKSQIGSQQQVDDARVLLAEAKTNLAVATAAVELWQKALADLDRPNGGKASPYSLPLVVPADGEVTDLLARPGMAVEAGAVVAQVTDFRHPLVRLDVPAYALAGGPPARVRVAAVGAQPPGAGRGLGGPTAVALAPAVDAGLIGPAPRVDAVSQFAGFWYAIDPPPVRTEDRAGAAGRSQVLWRPGLQVEAQLQSPSAPVRPAVAVPADAVLYHEGAPLVFVRAGPGRYERRPVRLLGREGDRWVLATRSEAAPGGVGPGEAVVSAAAQVLLSEQLRGGEYN